MALTYTETNYPITFDRATNRVIYYDENSSKNDKEAIGDFEIMPNLKLGFEVVYVCGAMGSGKSWFAKDYAVSYRKIFPKNNIFVLSQKESDPSFDKFSDIGFRRVKIDENFLKKDMDITKMKEMHNSLIIFDDFMNISCKKLTEKVVNLILQCITLGRQFHIYTVITSHMFYSTKNKDLYMNIQNEVNRLVWFKGVNVFQLRYILTQYFGYNRRQVHKLLNLDADSRFTSINKFPAYALTKYRCLLL
jgi:hypothetical protein